jgi:hypothetical protein
MPLSQRPTSRLAACSGRRRVSFFGVAGGLKPCGNCSRHVRTHERACPFCGEQLALSEAVEELRLLSRLDRSTMVALGAVLSAAGIALGCREAAPVAIYGAPAPPEQVQPVPSAAPPPAAPTSTDATVLAPAPSTSTSASPAPVTTAPAPTPAPTLAVKPAKPPASARPLAPAAAYGAPPSMGPPGGVAPVAPLKPGTQP